MKWAKRLSSRFSVMGELMGFLWQQRLWWLIPMVGVLLLFGLLLLFAQSSPLAPFVYTLF
ncbi:MAG: hypothetical protein HYY91_05915 [Candidatus Omnitrophica bacterium]|nr:hypothetical protein [Candidatus Omnitrophota bacterium]